MNRLAQNEQIVCEKMATNCHFVPQTYSIGSLPSVRLANLTQHRFFYTFYFVSSWLRIIEQGYVQGGSKVFPHAFFFF